MASRARSLAPLLAGGLLAVAASPALADGGCALGDPAFGTPRQDLAPAVLGLVNEHRASIGRAPLVASPALTRAALWKSGHMIAEGYFGHHDEVVDRTPWERAAACGYPDEPGAARGAMGENIAYGQGSPGAVMAAWLASSGHRANIEGGGFRAIGIGVARTAGGRLYWTQVFGGAPPPATGPLAARADRVEVAAGAAPVRVDVLANDDAPFGRPLRLEPPAPAAADAPADAGLAPDGEALEVRARPGRAGTVRLVYGVSDISGARAEAELVVVVGAQGPGGAPAPDPASATPGAGAAAQPARLTLRGARRGGMRVQVRARLGGRVEVFGTRTAARGRIRLPARLAGARVLAWRPAPVRLRRAGRAAPNRVRVRVRPGARVQLVYRLGRRSRLRTARVGRARQVRVPAAARSVRWRPAPARFRLQVPRTR